MAFHVILDYGHGGSKAGAVYAGAVEKQLNYLTGNEIYHALHQQKKERELRVLLTRDEDYDVPLRLRCDMINQCKRKYDVDLAVSIHYNAAGSSSAKGFEVFYLEGSQNGAKAAKSVVEHVADEGFDIRGLGAKTTKQLGRRLAFIHKTKPPAILVEVGFLTNVHDRTNAMQRDFRQQIAKSIAGGIWKHLDR